MRSLTVRQLAFGWLHFALALPSIYLLLGMPLVLREQGWSGTQIGLLQLAGLPAVLKLLMAFPVERCRPAGGGYRAWAGLLGVLLCLALLGLAYDLPLTQPLRFVAWVLLISLLATWADVPVNALAIRCLPAGERLRAGSIRSAALFLAAVVGGGLLLVLHQRAGGTAPFVLMALLLAVGGIILCALETPAQGEGGPTSSTSTHDLPQGSTSIGGFFLQPSAAIWVVLLMLLFPFVGAGWVYLKPLLLDLGMPAEQVAWWVGVGGGTAGALASLAGQRLTQGLGIGRALPLYAGLGALALACLGLVSHMAAGQTLWLAGAGLLACAMGALSGLVFGLMMHFARPGYRALDYGLQASLFTLSRLAMPILAGVLLDGLGYAGMFMVLALGMVAVGALTLPTAGRLESALSRVLPPKPAA
ncbi:MFS transporter [Halomonas sp. KM-1]|jgi:PAT family beta-lactamase induction signal transducer AmpG|uniref:MFS transporter n=1 Tax=Halomonas sp. KM-1 TaxID=590061 RepID=UPI000288D1D1|nr:MFS transporter [Halomonas sp. KM-1]